MLPPIPTDRIEEIRRAQARLLDNLARAVASRMTPKAEPSVDPFELVPLVDDNSLEVNDVAEMTERQ